MGTQTLRILILALAGTLPLAAQSTQQESLGDVARQVREQHTKDTKKPVKVFTNDDLPAPKPNEAVNSGPPPPPPPSTSGAKPDKAASTPEAGGNPPASGDDKEKTRDYWQGKFRQARRDLAAAKSAEQLTEDELNLLQIQQAREIDPNLKADLTTRVQAKQSDVDVNKATVEAAQKNLDDLEQSFKDSGAPDDWSQTDGQP